MFPVTKIQHFCTGDGPGVRTTVFLKGCPLRCVWCHNPETWSDSARFFYSDRLCIGCAACVSACPAGVHQMANGRHVLDRTLCLGCGKCTDACPSGALEKCVEFLSAEEILDQVMKDEAFYGAGGGVTFSGGEPTLHAEKLIPLLRALKQKGVRTALETCGYFDPALLPALVSCVDLFLWDVKDTDAVRHTANTGVSPRRILDCLRAADALGAETVMRCILLKTINLNEEHLHEIVSLYRSLSHCRGIEPIPYHTYGVSKNAALGRPASAHPEWIPSAGDMGRVRQYIRRHARLI